MIIPIKCVTCGNVIADKYLLYTRKVIKGNLSKQKNMESDGFVDRNSVLYLSKDNLGKTVEGKVLDDLRITKVCCRRVFLTHVDID